MESEKLDEGVSEVYCGLKRSRLILFLKRCNVIYDPSHLFSRFYAVARVDLLYSIPGSMALHSGKNYLLKNPFLTNSSAICTAFVAAPFLRLSLTIQQFKVFACVSSRRRRPTNVSSLSCAVSGMG